MAMKSNPAWITVASDHAIVTGVELLQWIEVDLHGLRNLISKQGFPKPRFGGVGSKPVPKVITANCRWKVGDVRAWLSGSKSDLDRAMNTPVAAERSNRSQRTQQTLEDNRMHPFQRGRPPLKHIDWNKPDGQVKK